MNMERASKQSENYKAQVTRLEMHARPPKQKMEIEMAGHLNSKVNSLKTQPQKITIYSATCQPTRQHLFPKKSPSTSTNWAFMGELGDMSKSLDRYPAVMASKTSRRDRVAEMGGSSFRCVAFFPPPKKAVWLRKMSSSRPKTYPVRSMYGLSIYLYLVDFLW